jgi:hypothetical protein
MHHDSRIAKWLSRLVPKHISEVLFWKSYFSHVQAVIDLDYIPPHLKSSSPTLTSIPYARLSLDGAETQSTSAPSTPRSVKAGLADVSPLRHTPHRRLQSEVKNEVDYDPHNVKLEVMRVAHAEGAQDLSSFFHAQLNVGVAPVVFMRRTDWPPIRWGIIGCSEFAGDSVGVAFKAVRGTPTSSFFLFSCLFSDECY